MVYGHKSFFLASIIPKNLTGNFQSFVNFSQRGGPQGKPGPAGY